MAGTAPLSAATRPAERGDYKAVREVLARCLPLAYGGLASPQKIQRGVNTWTQQAHAGAVDDLGDSFCVATVGGRVVGFAQAWADESGRVWLQQLHVLPEYQGRWIGKRLFDRMMEAAMVNYGQDELYTTAPSAQARRFVEQQGAELIGEDDVGTGVVEPVYRKEIGPRFGTVAREVEVPQEWMRGVRPGVQQISAGQAMNGAAIMNGQ